MDYTVGMKVFTRKKHPCGSDTWEIERVGADFVLKCLGCGRIVMVPRSKAVKIIKVLDN